MVKIDIFKLFNSSNSFQITFELASCWILLSCFSKLVYRFQGRPGSPHITCAAVAVPEVDTFSTLQYP